MGKCGGSVFDKARKDSLFRVDLDDFEESGSWEQEEGVGDFFKRIIVSKVYDSQSAFLKLWNVLNGQGGLVTSGREIRMGRWSDLRVVRVVQEKSIARWADQRDRSVEVGISECARGSCCTSECNMQSLY